MAVDGGLGPKRQPRFLDGGAPDIAVDPSAVADYAAYVGNRIVGTAAERTAATAWAWEGLEWRDTDGGEGVYEYSGSSWVLLRLPDTGWIDATLLAPWVLNTTAPAYRRLNGVVYFRGRATAGTSTSSPTFTLPEGFRPVHTRVQGLDAAGSYTRSQVQNTGGVGPVSAGAYSALSFDGITPYPAAG